MTKVGVGASTPSRKRVLYFSILNIVACFGVIMLHCNSAAFWGFEKSKTWISGNLIETLFYFPVPIFFMLSGATLLNYRKRYSTKAFLAKRFQKTLIPFLFWSIIALFYSILVSGATDWNPLHIVSNILNTRYMGIYWFFIALFAIYLSMPVLSAIEDKLKMKVYGYAIVIGLIFVSILPLACNLLHIEYNFELVPPVVGGYVIFILLGYYLSKIDLSKKQRMIIYLAGLLGLIVHFVGSWYLSYRHNELSMTFKGYNNLPSVLYAVAVFVWFKYCNYDKITSRFPKFEQLVNQLASLTFGIYLIHGFVVYGLPQLTGLDTRWWVWRTFGAIAVFGCCALMTWILKKIPILKRLVP